MALIEGSEFVKFSRLMKVDEATHSVWGIVTSESVDSDNEICDYEGAKEAFTIWSEEFVRRTTLSGADVSLGNLRIQHSLTIGGKATKIEFNDTDKQVWLGAVPVNDDVWDMLKGGYLTGFSLGGRAVKTKREGDYTRFWPKISEVSFVDNPACPDALFQYVKLNGSMELRKFRTKADPDKLLDDIAAAAQRTTADFSTAVNALKGDKGDTSTMNKAVKYLVTEDDGTTHLPYTKDDGKPNRRLCSAAWAALHDGYRGNKYEGPKKSEVISRLKSIYEDQGWDLPGKKAAKDRATIKAALVKSFSSHPVLKSMYSISTLASLLQDLMYLRMSSLYEADYEDDDRDLEIADSIALSIEQLSQVLKDMVEEETSELTPARKASNALLSTQGDNHMVKSQTSLTDEEIDQLAKAGHTMKAHFHKAAAHYEKSATAHLKMAESHTAEAESNKSLHEQHKAAGSKDDHFEKAHNHFKAMASECMKLHKSATAMSEHCKAMADKQDDDNDKAINDKAIKAIVEPMLKAMGVGAAGATGDPVTPPVTPVTPPVTPPAPSTPTIEGVATQLSNFEKSFTSTMEKLNSTLSTLDKLQSPSALGTPAPGAPAIPGIAPGLQMVTRGVNKAAAPKDDHGI